MKPAPWLWLILIVGAAALAFLPTRADSPRSARMSTLTKPKHRTPASARKTLPAKAHPYGFSISPVTGLPIKPLAPGKKPISREMLKAALTESL